MHPLSCLLLLPILPAAAALMAGQLRGDHAAGLTAASAGLALAIAVGRRVGYGVTALAVGLLAGFGVGPATWSPSLPWLVLRWDLLSAVMVTLVAFLGLAILRYSRRYLDGDPGQARFCGWLSATLASVLLLAVAGHLAVLIGAWIITSLCLHRLLLFYPQRPGARFAARKKFVISRLGDAALIAATVLLYRQYGTLEFDSLFAAVAARPDPVLSIVTALLGLCAMCKSAQLPFHTWLPDTMDTPTPVSAFMHAGIINAGGFLLIRLAPVTAYSPGVMTGVAIIGALTAAFGAVVMLTQPAVKRALAYSTIAQMGFMIMQCGLGATGLALVHLVGHSLYKAHAFLNSGSTVGAVPRAAIPLSPGALGCGAGAAAVLVGGGMTIAHTGGPAAGVFALVTALAVAYALARRWSATPGPGGALRALPLGVLVIAVSLGLHRLALAITPESAVINPVGPVFVGLIFLALFFTQAFVWRAPHVPWAQRVYVHALNGFYLGTLANRQLGRLWPRP
ncbi:MAG: proton-conducting transporter membrane subunit, partial [Cephaloticoccus sp.]